MADILDRARYGVESHSIGSVQGSEVDATYLVTYRVRGDRISNAHLESVPSRFTDEQNDIETQQRVWDYFVALIPADERSMLGGYVILTDGRGNILGAVAQISRPGLWALEIDIADSRDARNLTYTFLHEFGHLLTLNADQVPPSKAIFNNPEDNQLFEREAAACSQYFPGEGCSRASSYINVFFNQFWTDIYDKWIEIDREVDEQAYQRRLEDFYNEYQDRFVSDYAVTSPEEDIAETWSYFVLGPKPDGRDIADQKVLSFYNYPELVRLRDNILGNLCAAFPK
jgi:hypothetical protein